MSEKTPLKEVLPVVLPTIVWLTSLAYEFLTNLKIITQVYSPLTIPLQYL